MALNTYRAPAASVRIFVFREGLARALGHDIEIDVESFTLDVDVDARSLDARFDASSLRTLHAVKDGAPDAGALSANDRETIDEALAEKVLKVRRHPEVRFVASKVDVDTAAGGGRVEGALTLHGVTRGIACDVVRDANGVVTCEVVIDQAAFGIEPFRAFAGALKVKQNVVVRVRVPT